MYAYWDRKNLIEKKIRGEKPCDSVFLKLRTVQLTLILTSETIYGPHNFTLNFKA